MALGWAGGAVCGAGQAAPALRPLAAPLPLEAACAPVGDGAESVAVAEVVSPVEIKLDDGRLVRLAEVGAVVLDPGDPRMRAGVAALAALVSGRVFTLEAVGAAPDRHGRLVAHLAAAGGAGPWLQYEMVSAGLLYVDTSPKDQRCAQRLLAAEAAARRAGAGLWRDGGGLSVLTPEEAVERETGFFIVEGTVLSAQTVRDTTYLNFGPYWKTDFTVVVRRAVLAQLLADGFDPLGLAGRRVRVRGYATAHNGPEITLTHYAQIEILPSP